MFFRRTALLVLSPALVGACLVATAGMAVAATTTLSAHATAAAEVKPGPKGATATATFTVDSSSGKICYQLTASGLTDIVAAHIHKGAPGVDGPVVVPLVTSKIASGGQECSTAKPSLAQDIAANPAAYYFNVHTTQFSAGAVRGQLAASAISMPSGVNAGTGGEASSPARPYGLLLFILLTGVSLAVLSGRRLLRR